MEKDRAAPAGHTRPRVVIDLDDDVVEPILAPKPVAWFNGRLVERPIVAPVLRVLAPGVGPTDAAGWQHGLGWGEPIGPPPQPQRPEGASRSAAIALALVGADATSAECDRHAPRTCPKPALRGPAGPRPDMNRPERRPLHVRSRRSRFPNCCLLLYPYMLYCAPDSAAKLRPKTEAAPCGRRASRRRGFEECRTRARS